jgi:hypothetical protein
LRRTLITLDRDYLDDRKFPPRESGGVLVLTAPEQKGLAVLLARLDKELFRRIEPVETVLLETTPLPLEGRKLHVHIDWAGDANIRDL